MKNNPILMVPGDPNSIFFEIFFKSLKKIKIKSPLILICSVHNYKLNAKRFGYNKNFNLLKINDFKKKLDKNNLNIIDVKLEKSKNKNIQYRYNKDYIFNCLDLAAEIIKKKLCRKFLNGPINKKILENKYLGITELLSKKFSKKDTAMLIYNKKLSVCPVTTHLPIKLIVKKISKKLIKNKIKVLNNFYRDNLKIKPKIAVAGLNPHCESIHKFNEDEKILKPTIELAKKTGIDINGPFPADTIFLKQNRKKFDVILGMYHDQVLTPLKTLFEYDAINITMGLPFLRVSPDHGPNEKMVGKNLSNPTSLIRALEFLDRN